MRYYWVKDRIQQQQFKLKWKPGKMKKVNVIKEITTPKDIHQNITSK